MKKGMKIRFNIEPQKQQIENKQKEKWAKMRHNSMKWNELGYDTDLHVFGKMRHNTPFTVSSLVFVSFGYCSLAFVVFS